MSTKELKKTEKPVTDGIRSKKKKGRTSSEYPKEKVGTFKNMSSLAG